MKTSAINFLLCVSFIFFSGCATMSGSWQFVANQNTREGYETFIKQYPNSELTKEAQKRIGDPDYAFLATCRIGTSKALRGYILSYPSSDYMYIAKSYVEFLEETESHDLKSYKQFIDQHPNNPFITEAEVAVPLLWLKEKDQKVGVVINVKKLIFKGVLGGGQGNIEKIRQKLYERFKGELEQEGVQSVLLDNIESNNDTDKQFEIAIIIDYSEIEYPKSSAPISGGLYKSPVVDAIAWDAASGIAGIIWKPAQEEISISIRGINNGVEYYSAFSGFSTSNGKIINKNEALKTIGKLLGPANEIVGLKGRPFNSDVSRQEKELLKQLKGADVLKERVG